MPCALNGRRIRSRAGFSLIELVMSLAIIGIAAAIAAPRYANSLSRYRVDLAARRVAADLAMIQRHARVVSAPRTAVFSTVSHTYTLLSVPGFKSTSLDYRLNLRREPYSVSIVSIDLGGDNAIIFNGYGVPDSGGQIVIESGSIQKIISIDGAGSVTIQ